MRTRRQLKPVPLEFDRGWNTDLEGDAVTRMSVRISGKYTSSGAGVPANESVFGYLGQFTVKQDSDVILDVDGRDLRHIGAMLNGGYGELNPTTNIFSSATTPTPANGSVWLPFDAFLGGTAIDAAKSKVVCSGRFRDTQYLGSTVTDIDGQMTIAADTAVIPRNAKGEASHYLPNWVQRVHPLQVSADDGFTIRPNGERLYIPGMLVRQFDASFELTNANVARTDGLVRNIWGVLTRKNRKVELFRYTWGELKMLQTTALIGFSRGDQHTGVSYVPFKDDEQPGLGEILVLDPGDTLEVHIDTQSTPEYLFSTANDASIDNVVASGDQLYCTLFGHVGRGPAFAEGSRRRQAAGI